MRSTLEVAAKQIVPAVVEDWAKGALRTRDAATAGIRQRSRLPEHRDEARDITSMLNDLPEHPLGEANLPSHREHQEPTISTCTLPPRGLLGSGRASRASSSCAARTATPTSPEGRRAPRAPTFQLAAGSTVRSVVRACGRGSSHPGAPAGVPPIPRSALFDYLGMEFGWEPEQLTRF
jgi:hypothetical protein